MQDGMTGREIEAQNQVTHTQPCGSPLNCPFPEHPTHYSNGPESPGVGHVSTWGCPG